MTKKPADSIEELAALSNFPLPRFERILETENLKVRRKDPDGLSFEMMQCDIFNVLRRLLDRINDRVLNGKAQFQIIERGMAKLLSVVFIETGADDAIAIVFVYPQKVCIVG